MHTGAERRIEFLLCKEFNLPSLPGQEDEKDRLCDANSFPSAVDELQEGCPLHSPMHLLSNSSANALADWRLSVNAKKSTPCVLHTGCGQKVLGCQKKKAFTNMFLLKQWQKTFVSDFIYSRSDQSRITRQDLHTMCQTGKCVCN